MELFCVWLYIRNLKARDDENVPIYPSYSWMMVPTILNEKTHICTTVMLPTEVCKACCKQCFSLKIILMHKLSLYR